jgi:hypothetical protein
VWLPVVLSFGDAFERLANPHSLWSSSASNSSVIFIVHAPASAFRCNVVENEVQQELRIVGWAVALTTVMNVRQGILEWPES